MSLKKLEDELLVYGYLRQNQHRDIPSDIIRTCHKWYHIHIFFEQTSVHAAVNEQRDTVTLLKDVDYPVTAYANIIMPSVSKIDVEYEYEIKLSKQPNHGMGGVFIGIDEADCKRLNGIPYEHEKDLCSKDKWKIIFGTGNNRLVFGGGISNGAEFCDPGVIRMIYKPFHSSLRFYKNEEELWLIKNIDSKENLCYRLCVYLFGFDNTLSVKLICNEAQL